MDKEQMQRAGRILTSTIKKMGKQVQEYAEQAILYTIEHGYLHYCNVLINDIAKKGSGIRRQALINMIEKEGKAKWDGKEFLFHQNEKHHTEGQNFLPWNDYDKEHDVVSSVDALELTKKFVKSMEKKVKDASETKHADFVAYLYSQIADYELHLQGELFTEEDQEELVDLLNAK